MAIWFIWKRGPKRPSAQKWNDDSCQFKKNDDSVLVRHQLQPEQEGMTLDQLAEIFPAPR